MTAVSVPVSVAPPAAAALKRLARREAGRDLLLAFNYRVAEWARPERLAAMNPELGRLLRPAPRSAGVNRWISRWILEEWDLEEPYCLQLEEPRDRLGLLLPESLEQLAEQAGLLLHAPAMQRCIEREQRKALVEAVGRERREFTVSRYPLYERRLAALGVAVGETAGVWSLDVIRRDGWHCLLSCLALEAPAFTRRVELKLPPEISLPERGDSARPAPADAWGLIERILRLERAEEWAICCC